MLKKLKLWASPWTFDKSINFFSCFLLFSFLLSIQYCCHWVMQKLPGKFLHCFCACRKLLINSISNIHDSGISNLQHPQNQEKPARVWFFICQKTRSNCFSGKADAILFLNIKLTSPKHCLSFKSMASTFPQKQSKPSQ